MTKTTKRERKWGKDVQKDPPKKRTSRKDTTKPEPDMYKILIDGSGFSCAMTYEDCIRNMDEMNASADKMRRPRPSLMLVKQ